MTGQVEKYSAQKMRLRFLPERNEPGWEAGDGREAHGPRASSREGAAQEVVDKGTSGRRSGRIR